MAYVAFSPKTTRTRKIPKKKKNEKTTCSVDREKQAVEHQVVDVTNSSAVDTLL